MNNKKTLVIALASLVILIIGASVLYSFFSKSYKPDQLVVYDDSAVKDSASDTPAKSEDIPAPDFTVTDIDGKEYKLSDFKGKPVLLNFWASWCGPCKVEMPDFDKAYQEHKNDINFIMVNMTGWSSETVESASEFIADSGYSFPVFYDTLGQAGTAYEISSIPTTLFIDADGNIVAQARGAIDGDTLEYGISMISE